MINENWYALVIAILSPQPITVENSFLALEEGCIRKFVNKFITDEDIEDMIKLKKNHTYKELGEIYCLSYDAMTKRIQIYKRKKREKMKHGIKRYK